MEFFSSSGSTVIVELSKDALLVLPFKLEVKLSVTGTFMVKGWVSCAGFDILTSTSISLSLGVSMDVDLAEWS